MKRGKSIWIKLIAGFLMLAGALPLAAAGRQDTARTAPASASAANCNPKGVFPIAKETVTFNTAVRPETVVQDITTNAYTKMLEDKCNVKFNFNIYPSGNPGQEKLLIEIASGGTLPELFINFGFSEEQIYNIGTEGIVIPLNNLYDQYAYYIPQQLALTAAKDVFQRWHSPDGNIYYVMGYGEQIGEMYALRAWMNTRWLDKLGLKVPTTTAEFRTVLEAFRDRDPNGNGKKDEIPAGGNIDVRGRLHEYLFNAFIYSDTRDRLIVSNGKVDTIYNKPDYRDALRYVRGLMADGLILDQLFTINANNFRGIVESQDVATVGVFAAGLAGALSPTNQMRLEYEPIPPLKGPKGIQWAVYMPSELQKRYAITRDCKNPEVAFRLGDFMCSEECSIWNRFGIPNVDWRLPLPGEKSMYDNIGMAARIVPILPW
ncbi:MAG: extracellular solute-binding protein, partial [Treponema sp.]|nr:extracellular solute-binding protein [Treponema sp.]